MSGGIGGSGADDAARRAVLRAERRAFIRAAHPDRGGDPETFMRGLAELDGRVVYPVARPRVYRSRRPDRVVGRLVRELRRRTSGQPPRRNLQ